MYISKVIHGLLALTLCFNFRNTCKKRPRPLYSTISQILSTSPCKETEHVDSSESTLPKKRHPPGGSMTAAKQDKMISPRGNFRCCGSEQISVEERRGWRGGQEKGKGRRAVPKRSLSWRQLQLPLHCRKLGFLPEWN